MAPTTQKEAASRKGDYDAVRRDIASILKQPDYDDGSIGPVLVRLAWHASGTYDKESNTGGSNGAGMRYECEGGDPANAGLEHARRFLEPIKEKHPWITYADLWTLAGVTAIKEMGGPECAWKPGRTDFVDDSKCPPRGRLPDGALAADHLRHVFYRMGFNDQEIVALAGAHSMGRCHSDRSGFEGPWSVTPTKFSNQYYKLTKFKWEKKPWQGPIQFKNEDLGEVDDAPYRYGAHRGQGVPPLRQEVRRGPRGVLRRLCKGVCEADRAGRRARRQVRECADVLAGGGRQEGAGGQE
ncbi:hypothetical protein NBRC10512_001634 [Rhodotorula toruloides]|uniref:Peroxidase n=1 Tax=Rhodotorula toruloides (strain NP11) TaxID=1130832 RepID=M7XGV7_RHOT1|nr:cytochrome-c peroxidase [Rhodotorula toruloides NP11]EMS23109.1 cytochrome-c peroxidase [Rhodotorula toruloides NP11]